MSTPFHITIMAWSHWQIQCQKPFAFLNVSRKSYLWNAGDDFTFNFCIQSDYFWQLNYRWISKPESQRFQLHIIYNHFAPITASCSPAMMQLTCSGWSLQALLVGACCLLWWLLLQKPIMTAVGSKAWSGDKWNQFVRLKFG